MSHAQLTPPRRARLVIAMVVILLHVALVALLIRAFAPELGAALLRPAMQAFDVTVDMPPPPPTPPPRIVEMPPEKAGARAPSGKKAEPRAVAAPVPKIVLTPAIAPAVAGTGSADSTGSRTVGQGIGAGGQGQGTGTGAAGSGSGGGGATKAVKVAGDIVSAKDYPRETRALRLGSAVTIAMTVSTEGLVSSCRVVRASRDPEADRITCQLATARFRFRPARDVDGRAIPSVYGWQQRWFAP